MDTCKAAGEEGSAPLVVVSEHPEVERVDQMERACYTQARCADTSLGKANVLVGLRVILAGALRAPLQLVLAVRQIHRVQWVALDRTRTSRHRVEAPGKKSEGFCRSPSSPVYRVWVWTGALNDTLNPGSFVPSLQRKLTEAAWLQLSQT